MPKSERQLKAIMFTDIVGYTTMMQSDEKLAITSVKRHEELLNKYVLKYGGVVQNLMGDGSLCLFNSAVSAVECARDIQIDLQSDVKVPIRIGIHIGDVVIDGVNVYGDGVNLASRIETSGHAGAILFSVDIWSKIQNKSDLVGESLGYFKMKNVSNSLELFALKDERLPAINLPLLSNRVKKAPIKGVLIFLGIVSLILLYFILPQNEYKDYERAFYEGRYVEAANLAKKKRSLDNINSHFYYISAVAEGNRGTDFPPEVKREYQNLYKENPKSPNANFYLAAVYDYGSTWAEERDSSWVLFDFARKNGLTGFESELLYSYLLVGQRDAQMKQGAKLVKNFKNPPGFEFYGRALLALGDTINALEIWKQGIKNYPDYLNNHIWIANVHVSNKEYDLARVWFEKAKQINPENSTFITEMANFSKTEGRFEEAKSLYLRAIQTFGKQDKRIHYNYLNTLLDQDSIQLGMRRIEEYFEKFPEDRGLSFFQSRFLESERFLKEVENISKTTTQVKWLDNFEEAQIQSKKQKKPILIDFYTTWCYWCKVVDKKVFPDSAVQLKLQDFIPLKVNGDLDITLKNKYKVRAYPTFLVLDDEGKNIYKLREYTTQSAMLKSLSEGVLAFNQFISGKNQKSDNYTQVSNLDDAKIISKTKGIPIMMLVGDSRSPWSEKLTTTSLEEPSFKNNFTDIVYLPVNQVNKPVFMNNYKINSYPTTLFLDETGKEYYRVKGYQTPEAMSEKVIKAKDHYKKAPIENEVEWYYDLEEAKSIAQISKKNLFVSTVNLDCDPCNWMKNQTFTAPGIIDYLNTNYVSVQLENTKNPEVLQNINASTNFPSQLILGESGEEIFRTTGYKSTDDLLKWLDIEEKLKFKSIVGTEGYNQFHKDFMQAKTLIRYGRNFSGYLILDSLSQYLPDYYEIHVLKAECLLRMRRFDEAIGEFGLALKTNAPIIESLLESILITFTSQMELENIKSWFEFLLEGKNLEKNEQALIYWIISRGHQFLGDYENALIQSYKSVQSDESVILAQLHHGKMLFYAGDYDKAWKAFSIAKSLDNTNPNPPFYLGLIEREKGNSGKSQDYFNEARNTRRFASSYVTNNYIYEIYNFHKYPDLLMMLNMGNDYSSLMNPTGGGHYDKALDLLQFHGDYENALVYMDKYLKNNPNFAYGKLYKGWILFEIGRDQEAIDLIQSIIKLIDTHHPDPHNNYALGLYYENIGEIESSKFHFERVRNYRGPQLAYAQIIMSQAQERLDRKLLN